MPYFLDGEVLHSRGCSGGVMVLGKFPVPRRPTNLDNSWARAYCACSKCGWGCLDIFSLSSSLSLSLGDGLIYTEILSQNNQPTNPRSIRFVSV